MKTSIGARALTENEVNLILPTYDRIFEQINEMRSSLRNSPSSDSVHEKTNNIGLLGCRGAGKTSVLKTIEERLKKENNGNNGNEINILLPRIVPDNMSDASTTMATILGQFKTIIESRSINTENKSNECRFNDVNKLKGLYREVLNKFSLIQKEYRSILINDFTNFKDYTEKSSDIFNADSRFIDCFNEFLDELVKTKEGKNNKMIFIFIDDIDLSTHRSSDVIKSLLSYISHPNVVTIISGDLDTFEEAISIDLLRKEGALHSHIWEGQFLGKGKPIDKNLDEDEQLKDSYYNLDRTLIERKKSLSYEYLKKIIPPVYRHSIIHWSLDKRHNYVIQDNSVTMNLAELLEDTLRKLNPKFPRWYFKILEANSDNQINNTFKPLIQTYHMFDDTSRGLNNVYNTLVSIHNDIEKLKTGALSNEKINEKFYQYKKNLIETISSSKLIYNNNRTGIFTDIIQFGIDENTTQIRFDNLMSFLGYDDETKRTPFNEVEKFQLFILVDFSARLLNVLENQDEISKLSYERIKREMVKLVINNPSISGSSIKMASYTTEHISKLKDKDKFKDDYLSAAFLSPDAHLKGFNGDGAFVYNVKMESNVLVIDFLLKPGFDFFLLFYSYLSKDTFDIFDLKGLTNISSKRYAFINAVYTVYECMVTIENNNNHEETLIGLLSDHLELLGSSFYEIQKFIPNTTKKALVDVILDELNVDELVKKNNQTKRENEAIVDGEISNREKYITSNELDKLYAKLFVNAVDYYVGEKIYDEQKSWIYDRRKKYRQGSNKLLLLDAINELSLTHKSWESDKASSAIFFLINQVQKMAQSLMPQSSDSVQVIAHEFNNKSYLAFKNLYKGGSGTLANKVYSQLNQIMYRISEENINCSINDWYEMIKIADGLANNNRVWYGQAAARNMVRELYQMPMNWKDKNEIVELFSEYFFFFSQYVLAKKNSNEERFLFNRAKNFLGLLEKANEHHEIQYVEDFENSVFEKYKEFNTQVDKSEFSIERILSSDN